MILRTGIALFSTILVLAGCSNDGPTAGEPGKSPDAPAVSVSDLLAGSDSLRVDGAAYHATAGIYRNFQPVIGGESDHRLVAYIRLFSAEVDSIPPALHPKYVWVIHGVDTWGAQLQFENASRFPVYVQARAFGGPEWGVDDSVRVVTGIPDSTGGIRLLRCPDTTIRRLD